MSAPPPVRLAYAAAHLALAPGREELDWQATMGLRRFIDAQGLGVAEAMDTAQRFEIGWELARELIAATGALGLRHGFCAGAGTDQRERIAGPAALVDAAVEQCEFIAGRGGIPVLLPMPWLVRSAATEDTYVEVYGAILRQLRGPLFVHWLSPVFLPELEGYFPGDSFARVMALAPEVARGCKLSLLDPAREVAIRRALLPRAQIVLTGDDLHFARLLLGGGAGGPAPTAAAPVQGWTEIGGRPVALGDFSHALLGILDAIALPAGAALAALARGDTDEFRCRLEACEALGRWIFQPPVAAYKAGLAFLSWLNGLQPEFRLPFGREKARDREHLRQCAELARACGAVVDREGFARRLATWL